jgi:uncharacterized protein (DUF1810 family)
MDKYYLSRFKNAHDLRYKEALEEIKAGHKTGHWIWFIFPQIKGLGHSSTSSFYSIKTSKEALAFYNDTILGSHLREICTELLQHDKSIVSIMGSNLDAMKVRSSVTLFWLLTKDQIFKDILDKFFHSSIDLYTKSQIININKDISP